MNEVEKVTSLKGHNISTVRLYTNVPLAKWLLDHEKTTVGRLNTVRIGIPDELKDTKCRENFSVTCYIQSKETKSIYNDLFSENKIYWAQECPYAVYNETNSTNNQSDGKSKPVIIKFYDFMKGGTNIVDQLNDYYSCRARTNCWGLVSFFHILDTVRFNSKTVWCLKSSLDMKKTATFKYSWKRSSQLTKPFIENCQINGLGTAVIHKMENVLDRSLHEERPPSDMGKRYSLLGEIKRRCKKCEVGATKAVKDKLT